MNVPVDCRFSSIVADFSYTLYSRVFFTPKESILDVKPHPMSTMNVPFDRRFSSIVADFSVTRYSRVFFIPYENTRDVKPRPNSTMNVPVDCDFPRSMPISLTPCIVGYFSPLRKVFWTWNRIQWVQWMYHLIADFPRSLPIFQSPGIVGYFYPLWKYSDVKPRPNSTMNVPVDCRFPRSLPISLTPCIAGYFSPLRKVFWTWNRIQWV